MRLCCVILLFCHLFYHSVVVLFGPNVTLYDSVLLLCYFVVLSFCFNVLSFRYCSVLSFRPFSRFFCFNFSFSYTILPVSFVTMVLSCFSALLFYPSVSEFADDICTQPFLNTQKVRTSYQTHQTFSLMHLHLGIGV